MRALVITVVVVLVLAVLGWLRFSNPGGNPTLQVDTAEIKEDTGEMVQQGKAAVERVHAEIDDGATEEVPREPPEADVESPAEPLEQ